MNGLIDPASGTVGVTGVFITDEFYRGPYTENAPDLLVGYGAGYRASWDSVMGKVTSQIFEDNIKAWSGDHCIDPRLVPGVLFSSHKFMEEKPAIVDVAPTMLKFFGLALPAHFDGKPWDAGGEDGGRQRLRPLRLRRNLKSEPRASATIRASRTIPKNG